MCRLQEARSLRDRLRKHEKEQRRKEAKRSLASPAK